MVARFQHNQHLLKFRSKGSPLLFKSRFQNRSPPTPKQQSIKQLPDPYHGIVDPRDNYVRAHMREIKKYFPIFETTEKKTLNDIETDNTHEWQNNLDRNCKDFYLTPELLAIIPLELQPPNNGCYNNETNDDANPPVDETSNQKENGLPDSENLKGQEKEIIGSDESQTKVSDNSEGSTVSKTLKRTREQYEQGIEAQPVNKPWYIRSGKTVFTWFVKMGWKLIKWAVNMLLKAYRFVHPLLVWIFEYFKIAFPGQALLLSFIDIITSTYGALSVRLVYFTYESIKWEKDESFWSYAARMFGSIFLNLSCIVPNSILQLFGKAKFYLMGTLKTIDEWNRMLGWVAYEMLFDVLLIFCKYAPILKMIWGMVQWLAKKIYKLIKDWMSGMGFWKLVGSLCIVVFTYVSYQYGIYVPGETSSSTFNAGIAGIKGVLKATKEIWDFSYDKLKSAFAADGGSTFDTELLMDQIEEYDITNHITAVEKYSDLVPAQGVGDIWGIGGDFIAPSVQTMDFAYNSYSGGLWGTGSASTVGGSTAIGNSIF
jgi:hypothetical protein